MARPEPVPEVISRGLRTLMADVPRMAAECQVPDGSKVCYVCGAPAAALVMPGWGGVWLCRPCDAASPPP